MKAVGIRELKNRLSEYIRLVRAGEEILVTDRGEVVAEIRQPGRPAPTTPYPALEELARRGLVRIGGPNDPAVYARHKPEAPLSLDEILRLLDEVRGER